MQVRILAFDHLEIAMDNKGGVEVAQPAEHLLHDALDLRLREGALHVVKETCQVLNT